MTLNAYPASASSRGPDGVTRTSSSPSPSATAALASWRAEPTTREPSRSPTHTEAMTSPSATALSAHQAPETPRRSSDSGM